MNLTRPSEFLDRFPTPLHYKEPETTNEPWVFWSKNEESENNSSSSSADLGSPLNLIHDNIKYAFSSIRFHGDFIAQLWAPVTIGGRRLLSTSSQPFAVCDPSKELAMYRLHSEKFEYDIDVNKLHTEGPASVFLNRLSYVGYLLESDDCFGMSFRIMLPISFPSQLHCIGVLEFAFKRRYKLSSMVYFVLAVVEALQAAGLDVCNVQQQIPYKTTNGLTPAKDEIEHALKIVCKTHNLCLAQVWIPFEDKSHLPSSSNSKETQRLLGLKLTSYLHFEFLSNGLSIFRSYNDFYDLFPLGNMEEHALTTLQDFKPRYFSYFGDDLLGDLEDWRYNSCTFAICLRSIDTGDLNFAFEFIWLKHYRCVILLEAILLTMKRCLPSFKFASGVELGDELDVIDVECPEEGQKTNNFKIFQGKRLSPILNTLEKGKQPIDVDNIAPSEVTCNTTVNVLPSHEKQLDVICAESPTEKPMVKYKTAEIFLTREVTEKQFGKTMQEAKANLKVSLSTLKRKCKDYGISEWPGPNSVKKRANEANVTTPDPSTVYKNKDIVIIKAEYTINMIKFDLTISQAILVSVEKQIDMRFKLGVGNFKLKYLDEDGDWISLTSDEELKDCLKSSKKSDRILVRLRVLPS